MSLQLIDQREVLGKKFRVFGTPENPLFLARDVAEWIEHTNPSKMIADAELDETEIAKITNSYNGDGSKVSPPTTQLFLTEDGLYEVLLQSRKPIAKQFKKKVKEILKSIRKNGGYIANDELFIETYLPFADETTKSLFKATLQTVRNQNELILKQQKEIQHKEDVIIGLVDNIELAEKRQILNQVVRYKNANFRERWAELYRQFEMKYHIDLGKRLANYNKENKPKLRNKIDYIDKVMHKIPELYEIACKLYEGDIKDITEKLYKIA